MLKRFCVIFALCLLFTSCESIADEMPIQLIADTVGEAVEGYECLSPASVSYIRYCMNSDLSLYRQYLVLYPFSGTVYNEFGIFILNDTADKAAAQKEIKNYLKFKKENWDMRYGATDYEKIEHPLLFSHGRYLFYGILSERDKQAVKQKLKKLL